MISDLFYITEVKHNTDLHTEVWEDFSYLSPTKRYRWKEIILHSVHCPNNLLKHLFVTLLINYFHLLNRFNQ